MTQLSLFTILRDLLNRIEQKDTPTERWDFLANTAIETGGQIIDPIQQGSWTADATLAITVYNVFAQGENKQAVVRNWCKAAHCMLEIAGRPLPTIDSGPLPQRRVLQ